MFCPRCGSPINESLKYCRNCGLPISQISSYVATGGTANLAQSSAPGTVSNEYLTPKQRLILTIMLMVFSPAIFAAIAESLGFDAVIGSVPAVLMPIGIIWAIFHYKAQVRRREQQRQQMMTPAMTAYSPQQPQVGAVPYPTALPPHQTNPLADVPRGSVIEDETRKLPEER
jgi:hypothetical protein